MSCGPQVRRFGLIGDDYTFKAVWYYEVSSGTTGTVTRPAGGTILLDEFASGVDALCIGMSGVGGRPTWENVEESDGTVVVVSAFDTSGNFTLSGNPTSFPVAVVFTYSVMVKYYDTDFDFLEHEVPGTNDHGDLDGLDDAADHEWAIRTNGTRPFTGNQSLDGNDLTNIGDATASNFIGGNVTSGEDPGHAHTGASISGIDISDDTNLVAGGSLTLTDDTLSVDDDFVKNTGGDTMESGLTISDSESTPPLNVTERSSEPSGPSVNDIYLDDGANTESGDPGWRRYTGAAWEDISGGSGGGALQQQSFNAAFKEFDNWILTNTVINGSNNIELAAAT